MTSSHLPIHRIPLLFTLILRAPVSVRINERGETMFTDLAGERSGEVIVLVGTRLKCSHPDPDSYHLPQVMRSGL